MRIIIGLLLIALTGCVNQHAQQKQDDTAPTNHFEALDSPEMHTFGAKVLSIHPQYKFVVLDYTGEVLPAIGTKLKVYRSTKKVGEVRITEPVRINYATADILDGDLRVGDEAR